MKTRGLFLISLSLASVSWADGLPVITSQPQSQTVAPGSNAIFSVTATGATDYRRCGIFEQVSPKVSVRSETFRIVSEGRLPSTGARKRIEMIVRLGGATIQTLGYREDL